MMFSGWQQVYEARAEKKHRSTQLSKGGAPYSMASVDPQGVRPPRATVRPCLEGPGKHLDRKEEGRVSQLACGQAELNKMGSTLWN